MQHMADKYCYLAHNLRSVCNVDSVTSKVNDVFVILSNPYIKSALSEK